MTYESKENKIFINVGSIDAIERNDENMYIYIRGYIKTLYYNDKHERDKEYNRLKQLMSSYDNIVASLDKLDNVLEDD